MPLLSLDTLPLVTLVIGAIPLAWSGAVFALHIGATRREPSVGSMRLEAWVLALMIAPVLLGAALIVGVSLAPDAPLPTFDIPVLDMNEIGWSMGEPVEVAAGDATAAALPSLPPTLVPLASLAIAAIYLAGFAVAALRLLRSRRRLNRIVATSAPAPQLGADVRLSETDVPAFASACGAIVLPRGLSESLPARDLALIIRHERTHLDRGDPASFWLLAWADALFWFNPFVRRQTTRCRFAAELACDAAVVADAPESRSAYAGALVAAVKHAAGAPFGPLGAPGIFSTRSKGEHTTRLTRIMSTAPAPRSRLARLALASASLLVVPLGGLQLVACATGGTLDAVEAAQGGVAPLDTGFEITATDIDLVTVERIDAENLIRLTGPLVIRASNGTGAAEQVDLHLGPNGDFAEPRIAMISSPRVVFAGAPEVRTPTGATVHAPMRPIEMINARFATCGRDITAPKLGVLQAVGCPGDDFEIVADDEANIRVERRTDGLTRLHGPLRIRTSYGPEFETDSIELHHAPTEQGAAVDMPMPPIERITAAVTVVGSGERTEAAGFSFCGRVLTLPQLGQVEGTPCEAAGANLDVQSLAFINPEDWAGAPFTAVPLAGNLTSEFGPRIDPITGNPSTHSGIDIAAPEGTPIVAAADGVVTYVGWRGGYGRVVELNHGDGFQTRSAQMSETDVAKGDQVSAGDVIGRVGSTGRSTGSHVHWELWYEGRIYDPMPVLEKLGFGDSAPG